MIDVVCMINGWRRSPRPGGRRWTRCPSGRRARPARQGRPVSAGSPSSTCGQGGVPDDAHDRRRRREVRRGPGAARRPGPLARSASPASRAASSAVERAVPVDQGGRGLLADPGHARQAVAGVAAQRRQVGVAVAAGGCRTWPSATPRRRPRGCAPRGRRRAPGRRRASSTSWNRSRSPVTTSTSAGRPRPRGGERADHVVGLEPGPPSRAMPSAASTSTMTGTCGTRRVGRLLGAARRVGEPVRLVRRAARPPGTRGASRRPSTPRAGAGGGA